MCKCSSQSNDDHYLPPFARTAATSKSLLSVLSSDSDIVTNISLQKLSTCMRVSDIIHMTVPALQITNLF